MLENELFQQEKNLGYLPVRPWVDELNNKVRCMAKTAIRDYSTDFADFESFDDFTEFFAPSVPGILVHEAFRVGQDCLAVDNDTAKKMLKDDLWAAAQSEIPEVNEYTQTEDSDDIPDNVQMVVGIVNDFIERVVDLFEELFLN